MQKEGKTIPETEKCILTKKWTSIITVITVMRRFLMSLGLEARVTVTPGTVKWSGVPCLAPLSDLATSKGYFRILERGQGGKV